VAQPPFILLNTILKSSVIIYYSAFLFINITETSSKLISDSNLPEETILYKADHITTNSNDFYIFDNRVPKTIHISNSL